jgi:phosphatidylglycerophosphate synthase
MFDAWVRIWKERWLSPLARKLGPWVSPFDLTIIGFMLGVISAAAASQQHWTLALVFWIGNRVFDGLDGTLARVRQTQTDFGGYLDIVLDFTVYALIPVAIALALDTRAVWLAVAVLLASYFVNAASWMYLSAVLERRGHGAESRGELTTVTMPAGLIAGTETVVFFCLFLALPQYFVPLAWVMTAGVTIGILQRVMWSATNLR